MSVVTVSVYNRPDRGKRGIIEATKQLGLKIPLVVRLQGTKVAEGKEYVDPSVMLNLLSS